MTISTELVSSAGSLADGSASARERLRLLCGAIPHGQRVSKLDQSRPDTQTHVADAGDPDPHIPISVRSPSTIGDGRLSQKTGSQLSRIMR